MIFDYGGVLRREDAADFDDFAAEVGLPRGVLWAAFHDIPAYRLSRTGRLDAAGHRAAVVEALTPYVDRREAEAALAAFDARRASDAPVEPAMSALLGRLAGRGRLGLLSNAGAGARARLEALGVTAPFDDIVCSGDVGLAKPEPAIFRLAASRLGVSPEACFFIDDSAGHVEAARSVGMRAHHHHRSRMPELVEALAREGVLPPPPP